MVLDDANSGQMKVSVSIDGLTRLDSVLTASPYKRFTLTDTHYMGLTTHNSARSSSDTSSLLFSDISITKADPYSVKATVLNHQVVPIVEENYSSALLASVTLEAYDSCDR